MPHMIQFVTFRLADSLPKIVCARTIQEKSNIKSLELLLDSGYGSCILKEFAVASIVVDSIQFCSKTYFELFAYCIMPNHVHLLIRLDKNLSLARCIKSLKSFTAKHINQVQSSSGNIWFPDYFDRYIRDEEHFTLTKNYILNNPVKAGLCSEASAWSWSWSRSADVHVRNSK